MPATLTPSFKNALDESLRAVTAQSAQSPSSVLDAIIADYNALVSILAGLNAFAPNPAGHSGLNFAYHAGRFNKGAASDVSVVAGSIALTDDATNYIECDQAGTVSKSTSGWTAGRIKIAIVTTLSGAITSVQDVRTPFRVIGDATIASAALADSASTAQKVAAAAVTAEKLADTVADMLATAEIDVAAEAANAIDVTIQMLDGQGNNLGERRMLELWLADSATGWECTTAPDGGISVQTGDAANVITAGKRIRVMTDASGVAVIRVTSTGTPTFYLRLLVGSKIVTSSAITFT